MSIIQKMRGRNEPSVELEPTDQHRSSDEYSWTQPPSSPLGKKGYYEPREAYYSLTYDQQTEETLEENETARAVGIEKLTKEQVSKIMKYYDWLDKYKSSHPEATEEEMETESRLWQDSYNPTVEQAGYPFYYRMAGPHIEHLSAYEKGLENALEENRIFDIENIDRMIEYGDILKIIKPNTHFRAWKEQVRELDGESRIIRYTDSKDWIEKNWGNNRIDVFMSSYDKLPVEWKADHEAVLGDVVELFREYEGVINLSDKATYDKVLDTLHSARCLRKDSFIRHSVLDIPAQELPKSEKQWYITLIHMVNKLLDDKLIVPDGYIAKKRQELEGKKEPQAKSKDETSETEAVETET